MSVIVLLATGQSLSAAQVEHVRIFHAAGKCKAIAISNAHELAPWCDALVSNDTNWWRHHPEAIKFAGRKFCAMSFPGTETTEMTGMFPGGSNSGLRAMQVALNVFGATKLLLLGYDMSGGHYFGPHPAPLRNTDEKTFAKHIKQFDRFRGCEVVNCTPGSALTRFRMSTIEKELPFESLA